jgi:hypothetical protein
MFCIKQFKTIFHIIYINLQFRKYREVKEKKRDYVTSSVIIEKHYWYLQGSSGCNADKIVIAERLRDGQSCRRNT